MKKLILMCLMSIGIVEYVYSENYDIHDPRIVIIQRYLIETTNVQITIYKDTKTNCEYMQVWAGNSVTVTKLDKADKTDNN